VVDQDRVRIWVARLAAPVAFFLAATVLIVLVQRALRTEESTGGSGPATVAPTTTAPGTEPTTTDEQEPRRRRFYRVRPGDTLESIAARFDTNVEALLELNPVIDDPLALQPGQRIRIS
jgi:LysM repeat protein